MNFFFKGFKGMLPITTGIIPFGAVMGTVCAEAKLELFQSVAMNLLVFAGAAQLAAVDLMNKNTESFVIILTGMIINLRFMLYSAAVSPIFMNSNFLTKLMAAHSLTDQNYAVMSAHQDILTTNTEKIPFYFGASACMMIAWHGSVIVGFIFGNFAPASWALDYAVPLSFVALVMPSLKNYKYVMVAIFSSIFSLILKPLPYNMGLITTAVLGICLGAFLSRQKSDK